MPIIDSANAACDGCGVAANHPIMRLPDGWIYDPECMDAATGERRSGTPPSFLCPNCQQIIGQQATAARLSTQEFRDLGYLQEANRQFFHPLGLGLAIVDTATLEILDYRDDPEGVIFDYGNRSDLTLQRDAAANVQQQQVERGDVRRRALGWVVEPVPEGS